MVNLLKRLRKNRVVRAVLAGLKLLTLFVFGIGLVTVISALTPDFFDVPGDFVEALMFWGLRLILSVLALLLAVVAAIVIYEYSRQIIQRRRQEKLDAPSETR